jgi:hypothetical protein
MPTVLRIGPYRFFFFSGDCPEPPHVHIERDDCLAKFWLTPIHLHKNDGFSRRELRRLQQLVSEQREVLLRSWNEHCRS